MQTFELKANQRKTRGKGPARALRRQELIPAVLYGPRTESIPLTLSVHDLEKIYKESGSEQVILNLIIENGGVQDKTAMVKEVQVAPLTGQYLHIDFYEISLDEEIVVKVRVELTGKSKGVERGGFLQLVRHVLEISCLPADIPGKIKLDVSDLDIGDSLHAEDIAIAGKVKLLADGHLTVATVVAPTVEAEEEVAEEEVEEAEEAPVEEAAAGEETANK
ncbi:MAG: 50S ribosomal protein L25/general stress protein Ctc [Desulfobacterales bacterium]|nr:50S ribosomal protein L25/general stress protein Ctc [Desulfobacterales bacterium]